MPYQDEMQLEMTAFRPKTFAEELPDFRDLRLGCALGTGMKGADRSGGDAGLEQGFDLAEVDFPLCVPEVIGAQQTNPDSWAVADNVSQPHRHFDSGRIHLRQNAVRHLPGNAERGGKFGFGHFDIVHL
jgi:hypothetical protein